MRRSQRYMIRNLDDDSYLETFLVSAVAAILLVRFLLYLAGFPQVGGKGLHVAHLLWGGLLMVVGTVMLFNYLDRDTFRIAALVSGVGFGLFIDELGKFITSNNNYFYKPAAAIIYTVFVAMYLAFQLLKRERHVTDREYLINSIESFKEAVIRGFEKSYLDRAHFYLAQDRGGDPVTETIHDLMSQFHGQPPQAMGRTERFRTWLQETYVKVVGTRAFGRAVVALFVLEALITLAVAVLVTAAMAGFVLPSSLGIAGATRSYTKIGAVLFATIASVLVFAGAAFMVRSRLTAYRLFRLAMLISILLTEVFEFYYIQFNALFGLIFNILGLVVVDTLISQERKRLRSGRDEEMRQFRPQLSEQAVGSGRSSTRDPVGG